MFSQKREYLFFIILIFEKFLLFLKASLAFPLLFVVILISAKAGTKLA